jgi:hypothetical protein
VGIFVKKLRKSVDINVNKNVMKGNVDLAKSQFPKNVSA